MKLKQFSGCRNPKTYASKLEIAFCSSPAEILQDFLQWGAGDLMNNPSGS